MKVYTKLPMRLKPFFETELAHFRQAYAEQQLHIAWEHLERAHILGQRYPYAHSYVHWKMLQFGFRIKCTKEIIGQIPRLIFGGVKSFVGKVPTGNPGGANVPALRSFPVDPQILAIFAEAGVESRN
ncbi:MAG TPA: DUF3703 domain-containing protein [Cryomorphaceae bacterium]|nr:DUF3703 domain-containing protein [Cryomorphaceae bacterium]